jgi:hypothetical protein
MKVKAKCLFPAWESNAAVAFSPGEVYEIEHDGPLAQLRFGASYVFQFDRNSLSGEVHDYSCKKEGCGAKFKTLAELGRHSNAIHRNDDLLTDDEPAVIVKDGRGRKKGRTYTCKYPGCGVVLPNLYSVKVHKRIHQAETTAVPA